MQNDSLESFFWLSNEIFGQRKHTEGQKIIDNGTTKIINFVDFLRETKRHQKADTSSILGKTTQESLCS